MSELMVGVGAGAGVGDGDGLGDGLGEGPGAAVGDGLLATGVDELLPPPPPQAVSDKARAEIRSVRAVTAMICKAPPGAR